MAEPDPLAHGKKKTSFMARLIEWLLVTLTAAGVGVALTAINPPAAPANDAADSRPGKLAQEKKTPPKPDVAADCNAPGPSLLDLPPIVTNIADPPDTWIRLEAAIVFDPKTLPHPEVIAAEIATDELAYLRTVSTSELQGPIGLQNIRQDLRDRALVRSDGKITDLLLKTLVLQ